MTDRELLELAAKAAGLHEWGFMADKLTHVVDDRFVFWDPLSDDRDALMLAIEMGFISHKTLSPQESVDRFTGMNELSSGLRRFIVSAAARVQLSKEAP